MRDFFWIILAYLMAITAAGISFVFIGDLGIEDGSLLISFLVADVVATMVVFAFSVTFRNSSFYDPYWSIAPIILALAFLLHDDGALSARQLAVTLLTICWAIRLTWNWAYGWQGLSHEDWRYVDLRQQAGFFWWPLSFLGIHLLPTIIVFLGCLSMYPALSIGSAPLNWIDLLALITICSAIWLETQADLELHRFRRSRSDRQEILTTGVWGWCRHPNYLGEIGFWVGLFLFGYAAQGTADHDIGAGPISIILLFLFVSIPMIDRKLLADKPAYAQYKRSTLALIPVSKLFTGKHKGASD